jgi:hypothetical protein
MLIGEVLCPVHQAHAARLPLEPTTKANMAKRKTQKRLLATLGETNKQQN